MSEGDGCEIDFSLSQMRNHFAEKKKQAYLLQLIGEGVPR